MLVFCNPGATFTTASAALFSVDWPKLDVFIIYYEKKKSIVCVNEKVVIGILDATAPKWTGLIYLQVDAYPG
jgi:hypothetical protein